MAFGSLSHKDGNLIVLPLVLLWLILSQLLETTTVVFIYNEDDNEYKPLPLFHVFYRHVVYFSYFLDQLAAFPVLPTFLDEII